MRTAASESAIGELQIPLRAAAPIKLPTFWTMARPRKNVLQNPAGTIPPERNSCWTWAR